MLDDPDRLARRRRIVHCPHPTHGDQYAGCSPIDERANPRDRAGLEGPAKQTLVSTPGFDAVRAHTQKYPPRLGSALRGGPLPAGCAQPDLDTEPVTRMGLPPSRQGARRAAVRLMDEETLSQKRHTRTYRAARRQSLYDTDRFYH